MCEITYLFAYAISATAAMTGLAKYETKQRANAQMNQTAVAAFIEEQKEFYL